MQPLTVSATLASLAALKEYVLAASTEADLDESATYRLRLAVDEIATNIITHGYNAASLTGILTISMALNDEQLSIYLEDMGVSYDPQLEPPPQDLHLPPEERESGRKGIYLALHNVDTFSYERDQGCNRSTFVMRRPKIEA